MMEFRSIAIPCISSGVFGVPITVCSEAIVTAVKVFGSEGGRSLKKIILIDNREEVVRALHEACNRIFQVISDLGIQKAAPAQNTELNIPEDGVHVEILQGTIETQQVDALVSPMVGHDPLSTHVGNDLSNVVGPQLTSKFYTEAGGATTPGDTVLVQGLPALQTTAVIFLNLAAWDNNQRGKAVRVLREGIKQIMRSCETRSFTSLALPVLGTGAILRFPHNVVARIILEEVKLFERNRASRSPFLVRVVIHPNDKESSKAFQSAQETVHLRGFTNDTNPDKASFYRHISVQNNEVTAMLGGVKLQLVSGDIINEVTDIIVNTTDFSKNHLGVSKAILTAAGPTVEAEFAQAGIPQNNMCTTGPGLLHCREIIHARFRQDANLFQTNCKNILTQCESKGYRSVSFPAVNTGKAGMPFAKACKAMLDGLASAISDLKPTSLSLIRIVIQQERVFQAFKSELDNRFGLIAPCRLSLREKAKQKLKKWQEKQSQTFKSSISGGKNLNSSTPHPAVFNVICLGEDTINSIKRDLEAVVQKQLVERELELHDFFKLDEMETEAVLAKVKVLGLSLEPRRRQIFESEHSNIDGSIRAKAERRAQSESEEGVFALKGLKEDVLSVIELVNKSVKKTLCKDLQEKEEAVLALTVQWSIQDRDGVWQELSLFYNYKLENANLNQHVSEEIFALNDTKMTVNMRTREATDWQTGLTYKVKRVQTDATFEPPPHWEAMQEEVFKKVKVQPNSEEYQKIAQGFLNTANYNIEKIERVQNIYSWQAYSVCKQRIHTKNGSEEVGEMRLYHGTSARSCDCIEKGRFDRSYAGTNGAVYGKGVYFAIHADYSAQNKYSPADASGLKRLYVARVLTGRYTVGNSSMKAPPARGSDPTDCFDSLVDNQQQPTMFVVFHDDQAYPEYLITFR